MRHVLVMGWIAEMGELMGGLVILSDHFVLDDHARDCSFVSASQHLSFPTVVCQATGIIGAVVWVGGPVKPTYLLGGDKELVANNFSEGR